MLESVPHVKATQKPERCVRPAPAADAGRPTVHRGSWAQKHPQRVGARAPDHAGHAPRAAATPARPGAWRVRPRRAPRRATRHARHPRRTPRRVPRPIPCRTTRARRADQPWPDAEARWRPWRERRGRRAVRPGESLAAVLATCHPTGGWWTHGLPPQSGTVTADTPPSASPRSAVPAGTTSAPGRRARPAVCPKPSACRSSRLARAGARRQRARPRGRGLGRRTRRVEGAGSSARRRCYRPPAAGSRLMQCRAFLGRRRGGGQPASGKACHRAGELRIDWTEPQLRRSAMGVAWSGGTAGMPVTGSYVDVAGPRWSVRMATKAVPRPW